MQHAKKLLLVDPSNETPTYTPLATTTVAAAPPSMSLQLAPFRQAANDKALDGLDGEIKHILESDIPSDLKNKLYVFALKRFRTIERNKENKKIEPTPASSAFSSDKDNFNDLETQMLLSLPVNERHLAKRIYTKLKESNAAQFSPTGELVYRQNLVSGSNLIDLISDVLKRKNSNPPVGHAEFAQALREANVSRKLVINTDRWKLVRPELYRTPSPSQKPNRNRQTDKYGSSSISSGNESAKNIRKRWRQN